MRSHMEPALQPLAQRYRGKPVRRMHVMVKPTGALCDLDCTYRYYLSKEEPLGSPEQWRISYEVLETFIRQYFEGQNFKEVVFSWPGGSGDTLKEKTACTDLFRSSF